MQGDLDELITGLKMHDRQKRLQNLAKEGFGAVARQ